MKFFFKDIRCEQNININVFANFFLDKIKEGDIDFLKDKKFKIDKDYTIKNDEVTLAKEYFSQAIKSNLNTFKITQNRYINSTYPKSHQK